MSEILNEFCFELFKAVESSVGFSLEFFRFNSTIPKPLVVVFGELKESEETI